MSFVHVVYDNVLIFMPGITCPEIKSFANGHVTISGSGFGSTATYACNKGFILSNGFTIRVCKENDKWSGYEGVCKRT